VVCLVPRHLSNQEFEIVGHAVLRGMRRAPHAPDTHPYIKDVQKYTMSQEWPLAQAAGQAESTERLNATIFSTDMGMSVHALLVR